MEKTLTSPESLIELNDVYNDTMALLKAKGFKGLQCSEICCDMVTNNLVAYVFGLKTVQKFLNGDSGEFDHPALFLEGLEDSKVYLFPKDACPDHPVWGCFIVKVEDNNINVLLGQEYAPLSEYLDEILIHNSEANC